MSPSRSLLSLGLQKEVHAALTRNGYENLRDLISVTAEGLAKGKTSLRINWRDFHNHNSFLDINIPIADAQALIDRCQTLQTPALSYPMTQSAAVMVQHSHKTSTKCTSLDKALEGGISRGHILEISGPPGSAKEQLLMNIVAAFIEVNEEVIFIGRYSTPPNHNPYKLLFHYLRLPKHD
jgi:RAD51-like protein 2